MNIYGVSEAAITGAKQGHWRRTLDSRALTEGERQEKKEMVALNKRNIYFLFLEAKQTNMYIKYIRNIACTWRIPEKENIQGPVKLEVDANSSIGMQPRCQAYASVDRQPLKHAHSRLGDITCKTIPSYSDSLLSPGEDLKPRDFQLPFPSQLGHREFKSLLCDAASWSSEIVGEVTLLPTLVQGFSWRRSIVLPYPGN
jgi:hypothetical protein